MLHSAWMPVFRMYENQAEPAWEEFAERYKEYIFKRPFKLGKICGKDLRRLLGKMAAGVAG
eukprot:12104829-Karenia_brevis.AAC.1